MTRLTPDAPQRCLPLTLEGRRVLFCCIAGAPQRLLEQNRATLPHSPTHTHRERERAAGGGEEEEEVVVRGARKGGREGGREETCNHPNNHFYPFSTPSGSVSQGKKKKKKKEKKKKKKGSSWLQQRPSLCIMKCTG